MDRTLRRATPLVLLALGGLVLAEPWLPESLRTLLGPGGVIRLVVAVLCVYVVLLIAERERMVRDFKEVLRAFREFHGNPGTPAAGAQAQPTDAQKREALEILVTALSSPDRSVRDKAHAHLQRLTGQALPPDPAAWQAWLARQ